MSTSPPDHMNNAKTTTMNTADSMFSILIARREREASERARPAAVAIEAVLGNGVAPADLAHSLAIIVEDAGLFRSRCDRIDNMARMLEQTAAALRAEAVERRNR